MTFLRILALTSLIVFPISKIATAEDSAVKHATDDGDHDAHEAGHDGDAHDAHAINWVDLTNEETPPLVPMFFNFLVVSVLVYFILRKGLGAKIRNRKVELETALAEANALKKEAEEAMAVVRKRSDDLDVELKKMHDEIVAAAKAQAAEIEKCARENAERMQGESSALISQEIEMMAQKVRREAVAEIVAMAEKKMTDKLTATNHDQLAKEYVSAMMSAVQGGNRGAL